MRRKILSKSKGITAMAKDVDFILVELLRGGMEPMETVFFALRSHLYLRYPDVWEAYANAYKAQEN